MKRILWFITFILILKSTTSGYSEAEYEENECPNRIKLIPVHALKEIELIYTSPYTVFQDYRIFLFYNNDTTISCQDDILVLNKYQLKSNTIDEEKAQCQDGECTFIYNDVTDGFYCCVMEISEELVCSSETLHFVQQKEDGRLMSKRSRTILICVVVGVSFLVITITAVAFIYLNKRTPSPVEPEKDQGIELKQVNVPLVQQPRTPRSGRLFLLYHKDDDNHAGLVKTLSQLFEQYLQWEVTYVDENSPNIEIERGLQTWVTDKLLQSDKILVISSVGALNEITTRYRHRRISERVGGGISDVFLVAWHLIVSNPVLVRNYKKLFQVRFENRNDNSWLPEIVPGRRFKLPSDFQALVSEILGTTPYASSICMQIQRRMAASQLYSSFCQAIGSNRENLRENVSGSDSEDSCWIRPGL